MAWVKPSTHEPASRLGNYGRPGNTKYSMSWDRGWIVLCGVLAACSGPLAQSKSTITSAQRVAQPCSPERVEAILRPTANDELARAIYDRGPRAEIMNVTRAYEEALSECSSDPHRGQWLDRLASVQAHVKNQDAAVNNLRSLVCESRYPFGIHLVAELDRTSVFSDPYDGCVAAEVEPLDEVARKRLFDAWMTIGAHHADRVPQEKFWAQQAGSAFRHAAAIGAARRPLAELMEARTLYRQQRLAAAFEVFARLLERQEREAGPTLHMSESDARARGQLSGEAVAETIVSAASALAAVDFDGPSALAPVMAREDPLSRAESRSEMAEMLRVVLTRANDPLLLPSDRQWSAAIAMQLAHLLTDLHLFALANEAYATLIRRWPLYRYRPTALFELASRLASQGDSLAAASAGAELESTLSPGSRWMTQYADDAEAQELARRYRSR